MKPLLLEAKRSIGKGWGVFAVISLKKNQLLEICPLLPLSNKDIKLMRGRKLEKYWYSGKNGRISLSFGFALLYNHSFEPNVEFEIDNENDALKFKALRKINKGEELFINYNYQEPSDYPYISKKILNKMEWPK